MPTLDLGKVIPSINGKEPVDGNVKLNHMDVESVTQPETENDTFTDGSLSPWVNYKEELNQLKDTIADNRTAEALLVTLDSPFGDMSVTPLSDGATRVTRCGKNLVDPANFVVGQNVFDASGNVVSYLDLEAQIIPCKPNTMYTSVFVSSGVSVRIAFLRADKTFIKRHVAYSSGPYSVPTTDETYYLEIAINVGTYSFDIHEGIDTEFTAFDGETVTLTGGLVKFASLDGENNIYADTGNVRVEYGMSRVEEMHNLLSANQYGLPILHLSGDTFGMDKDNSVTLNYVYGERSGTASVKWQGSSSLNYDKKNYTIKFDTAFEAKTGWGEEKKYCFKANWVDSSHARNVVSARLWGQIVKSRTNPPAEISNLVNGGAVDGFPCIIMLNGGFLGLYTWNIPKDGWMLGMGDGTNEAIVCAEGNGGANGNGVGGQEAFMQTVNEWGTGFELEYITDEGNTAWAMTSLNNLISACMSSNGSNLDSTIAAMLDWNSAIDYWIFVLLMEGQDNLVKNYLLHTFDGTKWGFTGYDMDGTWGMGWDGKYWLSAKNYPTVDTLTSGHTVFKLIRQHKAQALKERYAELRAGVLSEDNVFKTFLTFLSGIPSEVYAAERRRWPEVPSTAVNDLNQIMTFYRLRCAEIDAQINAL